MKVVHLTSVHTKFDIRIFRKECVSLAQSGYTVVLIAPDDQQENPAIENSVIIVSVRRFDNRLKRIILTPFLLLQAALSERATLYHFHDPELIPIALILKLKGKVVVYDSHEDVPRQILSKYWLAPWSRRLVSVLTESLENFAVKVFDAVVTATPHIAKRFDPLSRKTLNVNNYPILGELEVPTHKDKESIFAYVGGMSVIRGFLEMVQAINLVEAQLLVAGKFSNGKLREKAEQTPGWQNVKLMGHLNRPQVANLLAKSVAGLVLFHPEPNHVNAQPNKMFEYMSAGLPVIASNFPLWKEIIEGNNCGICVNPLNIAEIAQAMQWILDNPEKAEEMGRNGYKAVVEKYNWDVEAVKLKKLYQDLLK